jgi:hypothetical protein
MITVGFEQTHGFLGNSHELMIGTVPIPAGGTVFAGMGMGTTKYTWGLPVSCLSHLIRSFAIHDIAFIVEPMATPLQIVRPTRHQLDTQHFHLLVVMPRANMHCLDTTTRFSVLLGPRISFAPLEEHVSTTMGAAFARDPPMELRLAECKPDPCCVVTPLNVNKTRDLLCKYGLLSDWNHILQGIAILLCSEERV